MNSFSSKIGVLLAAAGSAVGLGSIWKFPYTVGENGGGAFIILYIVCSIIFGLPLVPMVHTALWAALTAGSGWHGQRCCRCCSS